MGLLIAASLSCIVMVGGPYAGTGIETTRVATTAALVLLAAGMLLTGLAARRTGR